MLAESPVIYNLNSVSILLGVTVRNNVTPARCYHFGTTSARVVAQAPYLTELKLMGANTIKGRSARTLLHSLKRTVLRQVRFPTVLRAVIESLLFCCVFLAAGYVSLGHPIRAMLAPMVPVVFIMMMSMVLSGVYREEITHSIMNLYYHSAYGFVLATVIFVSSAHLIVPEYATLKFKFFFLFFAFFVTNTMRPLISGTDFMDGGGRRTN